jgi:hypothetical protein
LVFVAGIAAPAVAVALLALLAKPFAPDPLAVQERFRTRLTALSPQWQAPVWEECDTRWPLYRVRVVYQEDGRQYVCHLFSEGRGKSRARFERAGEPDVEFARVEIEGAQVKPVTDIYGRGQRVWDVKRFHTGAAGITGDAEPDVLERLAQHLVVALHESLEPAGMTQPPPPARLRPALSPSGSPNCRDPVRPGPESESPGRGATRPPNPPHPHPA